VSPLLIAFLVKPAVLEQPLYTSLRDRYVADGTCPHDELVSRRYVGRTASAARRFIRY
jgi:hypothetical protein